MFAQPDAVFERGRDGLVDVVVGHDEPRLLNPQETLHNPVVGQHPVHSIRECYDGSPEKDPGYPLRRPLVELGVGHL